MLKSILAIIQSIFWLIIRKKKIDDNPVTQIENEREQFQKAVADGDENSVNATLNADIQRLRDKQATGNADSK